MTVKELAQKKFDDLSNADFYDSENDECFDLVYIGPVSGDPQTEAVGEAYSVVAEEETLPYIEIANEDDKYAILYTESELNDLKAKVQNYLDENHPEI